MMAIRAITIVTAVALFGMLLGAAFGWVAASIAPSFFNRVMPWTEVEPVGFATVLGAFGGVMCGGALGVFAMILQAIADWRDRGNES